MKKLRDLKDLTIHDVDEVDAAGSARGRLGVLRLELSQRLAGSA